jgi:hypothetical protein
MPVSVPGTLSVWLGTDRTEHAAVMNKTRHLLAALVVAKFPAHGLALRARELVYDGIDRLIHLLRRNARGLFHRLGDFLSAPCKTIVPLADVPLIPDHFL